MAPSRIDLLRRYIAQRPADPFPRYGLAMEYKNAGDLAQASKEFSALIALHADYVPAYLHAGQVQIALGHKEDALATLRAGVAASARRGDAHARGELEAALASVTSHD